ncbi:MAG: hypothetical protein K0U78_02035 [Actinomycetia bacterium]|nr:hypothetical protein [Actinomycetes bacterium]
MTHLVWDDLIAFGTAGGNTCNAKELALAQRSLLAILSRIGITLSFPWRDFSTFKAHWVRNGCYNSWQARRDLLHIVVNVGLATDFRGRRWVPTAQSPVRDRGSFQQRHRSPSD